MQVAEADLHENASDWSGATTDLSPLLPLTLGEALAPTPLPLDVWDLRDREFLTSLYMMLQFQMVRARVRARGRFRARGSVRARGRVRARVSLST